MIVSLHCLRICSDGDFELDQEHASSLQEGRTDWRLRTRTPRRSWLSANAVACCGLLLRGRHADRLRCEHFYSRRHHLGAHGGLAVVLVQRVGQLPRQPCHVPWVTVTAARQVLVLHLTLGWTQLACLGSVYRNIVIFWRATRK